MFNKNSLSINSPVWLYFFIGMHLLAWTIVPAIVRLNLPLDAIEGTIWGHHLQWGYDKNPFMNGWLTAFATYFSSSGWTLYLFCQLSVVTCFWVVWQFSKEMLTPVYGLVAVMLLEAVQYFNFHALDFNDNTLELGLWSLTTYFFYRALRSTIKTSHYYWIATGFVAGLAMMAKYYSITLLAVLFLFLLIQKETRQQFKALPLYLGLITFLIVITPHIIWLFHHEFITITYVFDRASNEPSWFNHIYFPIKFFRQQLLAFAPMLLLFSILLIGKKPALAPNKIQLNPFNRRFLLFISLGPLLLTMLVSFLTGNTLRAGWGMPLLSFWSLLLLVFIQPQLSNIKMYRFMGATYSLLAVLLTTYTFSLIDSKDTCTANFPGREIAQVMTKVWHDQYHTKLDYVAGSRWVGGNIGFYSADKPTVYVEWDKKRSPWIDEKDFAKKGGIFIWEITENEHLPNEVKKKYPTLLPKKILRFSWLRNTRNLPPIQIGIAILPPSR